MIQCIEKQQSKMARLLVLMRQILKAVDETSLNGFGVDHSGFITVQNDKPLHMLESFPEFKSVEFVNGVHTYTLEVKDGED